MLARLITAIIGIPFVIWILVSGGVVIQGIGACVSVIAMYEYLKEISNKYTPMKGLAIVAVGAYILGYQYFVANYTLYVSFIMLIMLIISVFTYPKYTISDISMTLFGIIYVGLLLGTLISIRASEYGIFWVVMLFITAWGSDTWAYFVGRACGKRKLAPELSPKKTVEGAIGGIIGSGIMVYGFSVAMNYYGYIKISGTWMIVLVILSGVCAILSQIGDLAASSIKRNVGAKDFGSIFPGHGGVLDRFDSILLITPVIYLVAQIFVAI